ncbi:SET and MYND domain containing, class 3 isoform X2 [Arctopsyche grandis]|uniref:SET and MYND domain containing, class 3 isoform X2 n=1 Tax=Arctopsyche grandis TaxID=121162 RepID=UPI00406D8EA0
MKTYMKNVSGPIKAGTTIIEENPFAYILSSKERTFRCDYCFLKTKVLKCSGCHYIYYCGRICQKEAWAEHKHECSGFKRVLPRVLPDAARLLAKLIRKLAVGGGHVRGHYTEKSFRVWKDLMSHYQDIKMDNRRMEHFTCLCAVLFEFITDISLPNSAELMGIYGRMCINGFTILDPEMLSVGTGIYLGTSILDHSCEPNAVAIFHGTTINIRTLVDMPALDFSKISISYIDLLNTPFERQTELEMTYYFLCQCSRCLDSEQMSLMHAAKCPNHSCDYPIQIPWREDIKLSIEPSDKTNTHDYLIDDLSSISLNEGRILECPKCGHIVEKDFVKKFKETMDFTYEQLQNMKNKSTSYVDVCRTCLDRQENVLHPLSIYRVQTLDLALDGCIQFQFWDQAVHYANLLLPGFKNYYGERHPLFGLLYMKLGKLQLFTCKPKEARISLEKASDILKITHGQQHTLWKDVLVPLLMQCSLEN